MNIDWKAKALALVESYENCATDDERGGLIECETDDLAVAEELVIEIIRLRKLLEAERKQTAKLND